MQKISILKVADANGNSKLLVTYDQVYIKDGKAGFCSMLCSSSKNTLVVERSTHDVVKELRNSDISFTREVLSKFGDFLLAVPNGLTIGDDILKGYSFVSNYNDLLSLKGFNSFKDTDTDSNSVVYKDFLTKLGLDMTNYVENDVPVVENKFPLPKADLLSPADMKALVPDEIKSICYKEIDDSFQHSIDCYQYDTDFQIVKHFCESNLGKDEKDVRQPYIGFILQGEAGSTKSSFVDAIAAVTGYPKFVIPCNDATKLDTTLAFNKPNNNENSVRNFVVGYSPLTKLLPLTTQGVRVILCCDEGNQAFISFLKNLTSGWTSGSFIVKTDTFSFDIRNLIIFVTMNPDKQRKIEPSVFSRLMMIRRAIRTLEQKILYDGDLATVDDKSNSLFVINPFDHLINSSLTTAKGIGQTEMFDMPEGDYKLTFVNNLDVVMPTFYCGDDEVDVTKSHNKTFVDFAVKGVTTKYVRPKLDLSHGNSKLTFTENARIEILYNEMQRYLKEDCPIDDLSSTVNDHYESKLDSRHYLYFLSLIFMFRSVGMACYYMLYNIVQAGVVKFTGPRASEFAQLSNEQQAKQFAILFINEHIEQINSLHAKLFNYDPVLLDKLLKDFGNDFVAVASTDADTLLASDATAKAASQVNNNASNQSTDYASFMKARARARNGGNN